MTHVKGDGLTLSEGIEPHAHARALMEKLLLAVWPRDESEPLLVKAYYTVHLWPGVSASGGAQYVNRPGYNQHRGPVLVEMLRLHVDF